MSLSLRMPSALELVDIKYVHHPDTLEVFDVRGNFPILKSHKRNAY